MRPSQGPKYYCRSQTSGGVPCQDPTTRFPQGAISFLPGWNRPFGFPASAGRRKRWANSLVYAGPRKLPRSKSRGCQCEEEIAPRGRAADTERSACKMIASNRGFDGIVFSPQTAEWLCWGGAWCCRKKRKTQEKFPRVRVLPYLQQTSSKHSNVGRTTLG